MTVVALQRSGLDALAGSVAGVYEDPMVRVRAQRGLVLERRRRGMVRTPSFDVEHVGSHVHLVHRVSAGDVDDDLAGRLAGELFGPGWLRGSELFERLLVGIVLSCVEDPMAAWEAFYRQTLDHIDTVLTTRPSGGPDLVRAGSGHGGITDYAPVYAFAESLVTGSPPPERRGSVLELGCCFGFLSLRLARAGHPVLATDLEPGSVQLLSLMAARMRIGLSTQVADAAAVVAPSKHADHVLAVHLLEHVDAEAGDRILTEAVRLARRQVVVGVPLEEEAEQTWGHVRTISLADLDSWGRRSGLSYEVHDHHGGWLVLQTG